MNVSRIATVLSLIGAAFILYVGLNYVITPETIAPGFGLPTWPEGEATAFLNLKGVRDIVSGLLIITLLVARQRFALGLVTLVIALVPVGDMLTVLARHGSAATAFGVHGFTALLVAITGGLLLLEHRTVTARRAVAAAA
ncbi:DUF4267 domain-containing protein [Nocardia sp. AG03]|uniref:DUF4267 domain-containing protein n=1 Tax=Nocardia sp. AG03 TaxID=3025312 RepID=UPI0024183B3C|nr:DUF4267 domain-containing protein [Nocardia sp. AG03]